MHQSINCTSRSFKIYLNIVTKGKSRIVVTAMSIKVQVHVFYLFNCFISAAIIDVREE